MGRKKKNIITAIVLVLFMIFLAYEFTSKDSKTSVSLIFALTKLVLSKINKITLRKYLTLTNLFFIKVRAAK